MCQGVIVSLVKFNVNGKNKKIILKGIGSHSDLLKDNLALLKRRGWKGNSLGEEVISIESDFSGWNRFTVENGTPTKTELALLKRAYKECAGSARNLIAHVKKIGKIDNALEELFTPGATALYLAKCNSLYADYIAKCKSLYADYLAKRNSLYLYADYSAKCNSLYADYLAECKSLWIKFFSKKENRRANLRGGAK